MRGTGGRRCGVAGALVGLACAVLSTQAITASAATTAPDDPWFVAGNQWGLTQSGFPAAWCASTGAGALIAVIDGGVDFGHPDLAGRSAGSAMVQDGRVVAGEDPHTDHGHATHVAGIAAADSDNGVGMSGAAPGARLYSLQMLFGGGRGTSTDLATAIDFVTTQVAPAWRGPVILNISVGATAGGTPPEVATALSAAYAHGLAVALAAGDQPGTSGYASMTRQAMVVGALGQPGGVASYSPTGGVNVFAAGGESLGGSNVGTGIISTYTGGAYAWLTGTSMATPHVAAALALLMSTGLSNQQAYDRIQGSEGPGGVLRVDRALGRSGGCGADAPVPSPVRAAPRLLPPVTATAPTPATAIAQPAAPATAPAATTAPVLPSTSTVPGGESNHPRRTLTGPSPLAGTAASPRTGLRGLLATTSAGARIDAGRVTLAAAAAFAAASLSSLVLWRRLQRVRAGTR